MISALPCLPSVSKYVTPSKCNDLSQMKPIQLNPFYLLNRACPLEICCLLIIDPMRKFQIFFFTCFYERNSKNKGQLIFKKKWFKNTYLIKTHNPSLPRSSLIKSQEFCTKWICLTVKYLPSSCPLTLGGTGHVIAWFPIAGHLNVGLVGMSSQNIKKKVTNFHNRGAFALMCFLLCLIECLVSWSRSSFPRGYSVAVPSVSQ